MTSLTFTCTVCGHSNKGDYEEEDLEYPGTASRTLIAVGLTLAVLLVALDQLFQL